MEGPCSSSWTYSLLVDIELHTRHISICFDIADAFEHLVYLPLQDIIGVV